MPRLGCLSLVAVLFLTIALPIFFLGVLNAALIRLHLDAQTATLIIVGILFGSVVNVPVRRIVRTDTMVVDHGALLGLGGLWPRLRRVRRETIVAVNIGGCVIPAGLALYELSHLLGDGSTLAALAVASVANILVCYLLSRPVPGVGIVMPGLAPALVAAAAALLLAPEQAPPVAFISGVAGPLIGADLLRLHDITRIASAMISIGGAGTFDGILLSGIVAAYLA